MKEMTGKLLGKAERAIETTKKLLEIADTEAAVARAYYAMFYVTEALLFEQGMSFSKHTGVHGAFGKNFAKTGAMDVKYHRWLLDAFDKRIVADYGVEATFTIKEVQEMIEQAEEFLGEVRRYLGVVS